MVKEKHKTHTYVYIKEQVTAKYLTLTGKQASGVSDS